ncbi:MAG: bifunctional phosphoribosylaminoimidazolecarboxamide formyltransferase/IMP cyclohydrolase [Anaerolineae bacterium]
MPSALLSVSDKTGLIELGQGLVDLGWTLVASGGTAHALREAGLTVTDVAGLTGAAEMLGGRVKTLHPAVHAGILARATEADANELARHHIRPIDLVVCNLYPFQETLARPGVSLADAVEQIDIGGVALLRGAAKNFQRVTVVCDPDDYGLVLAELRENGSVSSDTRQRLAVKVFAHTRDYDAAIEAYLRQTLPQAPGPPAPQLPDSLRLALPRAQVMRYGENPHQAAGLYAETGVGPLGGDLLRGKPLSYNNLLDLDAAWSAALSFDEPTIVIVKHLSPCGIASAERLAAAFAAALTSDPVSAFGGVIAANRTIDCATAREMHELFVEAIAAPGFDEEALECFAQHKPNCRLVAIPQPVEETWALRSVAGGVLVQSIDRGDPPDSKWQVVSQRQPTDDELATSGFAWRACRHVKSNAIVLARGRATVGIGGGLPSRVDAVKLAVAKAGERARGAVMASDAFFPFPDGVEVAAEAGVTAVVQPGGSVRDEAVITAADRLGLAMIFTGVRHFRH